MKPLYFKKTAYQIKHKIVSFDIETYSKKNHFYMGGILDDEGYTAYYNKEEMAGALLKTKYQNKETLLYATNLAFDFSGIFEGTTYYNEFQRLMRGSDLLMCKRIKSTRPLTMLDTFNLAPFSLATLGKILGLNKLKSPTSLYNDNKGYARKPNTDAEKQELEIYNRRDCEVTKGFIEFFEDAILKLGGQMQITIASTAMDLYQRKYLKFPLKHEFIKNFEEITGMSINDYVFQSYAGGRTETFIRGKVEHVNGYDVNSLYPTMMLATYPYPPSAKFTQQPKRIHLAYEGVSKARVVIPVMDYPPLFKKQNKKLLFPVGTFTGFWTNEELRYAKSVGCKVELLETLYYSSNWYPFREYVNDLYALRLKFKEENSPMEVVVKLLLNSLYGKWGSRHITKTDFFNINNMTKNELDEKFARENLVLDEKTNNAYTYEYETCKSSYVFPIFASYTTAKARIHMHKVMSNYEVYYMDTDSAFIKGVMETGKELGAMKLEYADATCIFIRPKMYVVETKDEIKVKVKGLSRATREDFNKILEHEEVFKQQFIKMKTAIKRNMTTNEVVTQSKTFDLEDTKRDWEFAFDLSMQKSKALVIEE